MEATEIPDPITATQPPRRGMSLGCCNRRCDGGQKVQAVRNTHARASLRRLLWRLLVRGLVQRVDLRSERVSFVRSRQWLHMVATAAAILPRKVRPAL